MTGNTADNGEPQPTTPATSDSGQRDDGDAPGMHPYRPTRSAQATADRTEQAPSDAGAAPTSRTASHDHATVPLPVHRVRSDDEPPYDERAPRRWRWNPFAAVGRKVFWLGTIAGVIVILLLAITLFGQWPKFGNPFSSQRTDRSGPVLLVSIQDLSRFEAASGNFQVIVDIQNDRRFLPDFLFNERSLFVADGSVDAYVDFSKIGQGDIKLDSTDSKKVTIDLPAPQLEPPNLDLGRSYLYATQKGLINRFSDVFTGHANDEQQLYQLGQQKIAAAALDSQLPQRAEQNTRTMLTGMLRSLGFTTISVNFAQS